jgi:hypothetical protein
VDVFLGVFWHCVGIFIQHHHAEGISLKLTNCQRFSILFCCDLFFILGTCCHVDSVNIFMTSPVMDSTIILICRYDMCQWVTDCCFKKTGWLEIRIMCPSGATCLPMDCCFSDLALYISNSACCSITKWTPSSSYHWQLTCSRHELADKWLS